MLTFDTSSEDKNIRRALASAREIRLALEERKAEAAKENPVNVRGQY